MAQAAATTKLWTPLLVGGVAFGVLYALGELGGLRDWLNAKGLGQHLGDLQVKLNGLVSGATAVVVATIKHWFSPADPAPHAPPPEQPAAPLRTAPNPAAAPQDRNWQDLFFKLQSEARKRLADAQHERHGLEVALAAERAKLDVHLERRGVLKFTLYCGLALAFGSCVGTLLSNPARGGADAARDHALVMVAIYAGVSAVLAGCALAFRGRPLRHVPAPMFGVAALYVNTCALLISVPYTLDQLVGDAARQAMGMPVIGWIALSRFLILPAAAVVGSILGTAVAGAYLRAAHREGGQAGPFLAATAR